MLRMSRIDIEDTIKDIEAYRSLEGEPFNFGSGLIINESQISEDVYWKIELQRLKDLLSRGYIDYEAEYYDDIPPKFPVSYRLNKHARKKETQRRLKKLFSDHYYSAICYDEEKKIYYRWYLTGPKQLAKFCTNRLIRTENREYFNKPERHRKEFSHKCAGYRKVFDYWWTVF